MAEMAENGRKWSKMDFRGYLVGNGFPRVSRRGHRGDQAGNGRQWQEMAGNGRKWSKKSSPRLFGRKWISAYYTPFPYYYGCMEISKYSVFRTWMERNELM